MVLLSTLLLLFAPIRHSLAETTTNSFRETLTVHPLPDGKLSVLFEFTTYFTSPRFSSIIPQTHHSLTPPSLLLPLEQNNVSELTISFVAGQWDQLRSGEAGPLHYGAGGGGGEVRGWLKSSDDSRRSAKAWEAVTHALGGLFCAGLGPSEDGESVTTFGRIYPPHRDNIGLTHYLLTHPFLQLCTENLTPFLSLLPSKGLSGLSSLLAQPGIIFSWGFKTEGIEVIMPTVESPQGQWVGWWEGVVDLVPAGGGRRAFSIRSLFNKGLPRPFPEAEASLLRVILPEGTGMSMEPRSAHEELQWIDGKPRHVMEWDLLDERMAGQDVKLWWEENNFVYPQTITPPPISISRTVTSPRASDGTFTIRIHNTDQRARRAIYSEVWPCWVMGWMSEIEVKLEGANGSQSRLLDRLDYHPSTPPKTSTTTLHLTLHLPARSTLVIMIPFTKLTIKYTEHRPDAERGVEIPSGVLTLLDIEGEPDAAIKSSDPMPINPLLSDRQRIYTSRILLDVPTPDFSMPYNVIIMSSTVMAVFFGLMQGGLTRRWGWVKLGKEGGKPAGEEEKLNGVPK